MQTEPSNGDLSPAGRIELGKTGIMISPLGIGTWQWGDPLFWDYGKGGYTDSDLRAAFEDSLSVGINFFDTAESYGNGRSESLLGQAVQAANQSVVVATKFMPYPWRIRQASLMEALKRSLARMGLPRIDLYQIHWPYPPRSVETWAEALADACEAGLVRAVGVSNYNEDQMRRTYDLLGKHGIPLASNQVLFNLIARKPEKSGLLQACQELGVTLIAYSPMAQGLLTGKYTPGNPMHGIRNLRYRRYIQPIQPLIGLMREIGQAHGGRTPAQIAINWVLAKGAVPIPGAKNLRQARENISALGWKLSGSEVTALEEASDKVR